MNIEFEEKGHIYSVNGEIASISVTELLRKHGLAPDYSTANKKVLKESADIGKEVHKDLENILNTAKYEPKTEQGKQFLQWVNANLDCGVGEQKLGYEKDGLIIAGTADVMGILKSGEYLLADHKNTSKLHKEYVSWQVSILDYFARKLGEESVNGRVLKWKGAKAFICFHYDPKTCEMKAIPLEKIEDEEIEKLLDCELKGTLYQRPMLVLDPELEQNFLQAEQELYEIELAKDKAEANAKELREQLCRVFAEQGIKSWESRDGGIKVSYIDPFDRVGVDNKKLKEKYPQIFTEVQKITKVKESIRITIREKENE